MRSYGAAETVDHNLDSVMRAALTTKYVANDATLDAGGITGVNYEVSVSTGLLERVADAVVASRIVAPPITDIRLDEAPAALEATGHGDGKTLITMTPER